MNDFSPEDDRLRELLGNAVSDVEPQGGLADIRTRLEESRMSTRRSWFLGAGAAVVATAATIAAVVVATQPPEHQADPGPAATAPSSAEPSPSSAHTASESPSTPPSTVADGPAVPVYYPGRTDRGPRLYREFHRSTGPNPLISALEQAVGTAPSDPDYDNPWPAGTFLQHAEKQADQLVVDLHGELADRPADVSADEARIMVQQLVYTAQAATQTTEPVRFLIDGRPTDTLLGVPTAEPLDRADPLDALALVWIIGPTQGEEVTSPVKVHGLANTFEANVVWKLLRHGEVVRQGHTTAQEAMTMAKYSFTFEAEPGSYTLLVTDSDPSGGEGPAPFQDTKEITVVE